ncbi:hypothetical protein [Kineobactrum salinum]|uniref:Uncharacterized protein n=1 Tax=Kineobactrum salinum TaxID=2708301 RepID=A0A6C0U196_9GAMM|nr:hypothetical protein [Kineobactrum salinum]QIB64757.1 hypothetical protein G3T16_04515 [Kineobactrum salinum]
MIRAVYEYIYFNLYQWSVKVNGDKYYNNYSASLMMTLVMCINLTTLISIYHVLTDWPIPEGPRVKVAIVVVVILMSLANYKYFTYKDRGLRLVENYKVISGGRDRTGYITGALVFGSLAVLFLTWFIGMHFS